MTFDDKMSQEEIDDMFEEFELDDDGMILTKSIVIYFLYHCANCISYFFYFAYHSRLTHKTLYILSG